MKKEIIGVFLLLLIVSGCTVKEGKENQEKKDLIKTENNDPEIENTTLELTEKKEVDLEEYWSERDPITGSEDFFETTFHRSSFVSIWEDCKTILKNQTIEEINETDTNLGRFRKHYNNLWYNKCVEITAEFTIPDKFLGVYSFDYSDQVLITGSCDGGKCLLYFENGTVVNNRVLFLETAEPSFEEHQKTTYNGTMFPIGFILKSDLSHDNREDTIRKVNEEALRQRKKLTGDGK